ncbi:MAG: hypothetical protein FVQ85_11225 [Planctomycetes bacterium]|nr:hypothetical protein [Planctomycetota bacterium]
MRIAIVMATVAMITGLFGCTTESVPTSGVIKLNLNSDYPVGKYAPDLPFTSENGKETTFRKIRQPIAIVAFTSMSDENRPNPDLVNLAEDFRNLPVTVAQIYLPSGKYSSAQEFLAVNNIHHKDLVTLYDAERIALRGFGYPKPNMVFLIDDNSKIVTICKGFNNLRSLTDRAQKLAKAVEEADADHFAQ